MGNDTKSNAMKENCDLKNQMRRVQKNVVKVHHAARNVTKELNLKEQRENRVLK